MQMEQEDNMTTDATTRKVARLGATSLLVALGFGLAAGGTFAQDTTQQQQPQQEQQQPQAEAPPAAPQGEQADAWLKVCSTDPKEKKDVCIIKQDLLTNTGQFLASLQLREVQGEERKRLIAAVPPGMLIQPGLQVQIDKNKPQNLKYGICFPNACFAELAITDDFIASMKKGGQLMLTTLNQQGKPRPFPFTLIGFTAVYDGPGLDPKELSARQKDLQEKLQERAEEQRQKLIEAQRKAAEGN